LIYHQIARREKWEKIPCFQTNPTRKEKDVERLVQVFFAAKPLEVAHINDHDLPKKKKTSRRRPKKNPPPSILVTFVSGSSNACKL
jgi:hypothetical protein